MNRSVLAILLFLVSCATSGVAWAVVPCAMTVPASIDSQPRADASLPSIRALPESPCALAVGLEAAGADPYVLAHLRGKRPRRRHFSPPGCHAAPVGDSAELRIRYDRHQSTHQARRATSVRLLPRPRAWLPPATAPPLPRSA